MQSVEVDFYLCSESPRRRDLLQQLGYRFACTPVDIDETPAPGESGEEMVRRLARRKAEAGWAVMECVAPRPSLGADTAVLVDDCVLGKPRDEADALAMLAALSGREHRVLSAVAVVQAGVVRSVLSSTTVLFRTIGASEMRAYWRSGEPCDKAGAYAIQGLAASFVKRIEGSYTGVVGLPLFETAQLLGEFGISGWTAHGPYHE
jgi:septum formation protein